MCVRLRCECDCRPCPLSAEHPACVPGLQDQGPQTGVGRRGLNTADMCHLLALQTRSLKSRFGGSCIPQKLQGGSFLPLPPAAGTPGVPGLMALHSLPSSPVADFSPRGVFPSLCLCAQISSLVQHQDTGFVVVVSSLSCVRLFGDFMDSPGSAICGIFQARILQSVATSSSRGIFQTQGSNPWPLCLLHQQAGSSPLSHRESLSLD